MSHDPGWKQELAGLEERRRAARAMGGPDRLAKQRAGGRLDARARIASLCDEGSFTEIGTIAGPAGAPSDAFVAGFGMIDGRPVMVGAEDFTVMAGSIGGASNAKRHRLAELARTDRVPLVMLLEGAGHRPTDTGGRGPTDTLMQVRCSGQVPVVAGVFGPSAGHGALVAPLADFTVMTPHGAIFTAGPPVVAASLGETVTKEDLGGPDVALASGLIHNPASSDEDALEQIRTYLSYMPSSAWSWPDAAPDPGPRLTPRLEDLIPRDGRRGYDIRPVFSELVDGGEWFEVQPRYGTSIVCGLARMGGHPMAMVANQPLVLAGAVDAAAADKAAHFITVADSFHVPLLFVTDNPGMLPGSASERQGVLRSGGRMFAAEALATTPKINLTLRKAYGFGSMVMAMISYDGQAGTFAFPGTTLGAMGADAMSRALGAEADQAAALRQAELEASYRSAERLGFDEMIEPSEARNMVLVTLQRALMRRQARPEPVSRTAITP